MDPRRGKGSSSSKGRGRAPQSQPNYPQMNPQPGYYYPQMGSQYFPQPNYPQYFSQPPPMNPQYGDFDPFADIRDTPSRREASVERQLPLYNLDDEDDYVPETQPQEVEEDEEVEEVQTKKQPNKAEKKSWTPGEEAALAKAWVQISTCKTVGNEQSRDSFWKRILEHFKKNVKNTTRTRHGLNTKWKNMNAEMGVFNGLYIQQKRLRESGCSDIDVMKNALVDYNKKTLKHFTHIDAWEIVRGEQKWLEQPDMAQGSSSHSDKRRKSSESGNYESGSNNNVIPDLNDDTAPMRKRKGKKVATESSTKGSVAASFDDYTARKSQILETVAEKKIAKDEMAEKLMATQIRNIEEKAMFRALKFYTQPHDHITDPDILELTLAKKRELAEKYGWNCNF